MTAQRTNQRIDGKRLWDSLMEMAESGATPRGGVRRLTLTEVDRRGRDRFRAWCEAAGLTVRVDAIGNMFARREGRDPTRPPVLFGSHLDSQPSGGKFDGALGVLAGLELTRLFRIPAQRFDPECVALVREAAARLGYPAREIVSGARHDAVYVARHVPTAMIFTPCKDGLSHNEAESMLPQEAEAGAQVLFEAVLARANRAHLLGG